MDKEGCVGGRRRRGTVLVQGGGVLILREGIMCGGRCWRLLAAGNNDGSWSLV